MFTQVYLSLYGNKANEIPIEEMFKFNGPYQVLCKTEEEKLYLEALQLMYGKEIPIQIWDEWKATNTNYLLADGKTKISHPKIRLPAIVVTTYDPGNSLRGL